MKRAVGRHSCRWKGIIEVHLLKIECLVNWDEMWQDSFQLGALWTW
jgi:hypothetical protein